jgi:hypothetical protein
MHERSQLGKIMSGAPSTSAPNGFPQKSLELLEKLDDDPMLTVPDELTSYLMRKCGQCSDSLDPRV